MHLAGNSRDLAALPLISGLGATNARLSLSHGPTKFFLTLPFRSFKPKPEETDFGLEQEGQVQAVCTGLFFSTTASNQRRTGSMVLYIIGLGLADEEDITLKGLKAVKSSERVYLESYTSILMVQDFKERLVSSG